MAEGTGPDAASQRESVAVVIVTYALCGFANFASIGIQIGGYSGLAPERRADISRLALRAMIGGALTTCLVAAVAGLLT